MGCIFLVRSDLQFRVCNHAHLYCKVPTPLFIRLLQLIIRDIKESRWNAGDEGAAEGGVGPDAGGSEIILLEGGHQTAQ